MCAHIVLQVSRLCVRASAFKCSKHSNGQATLHCRACSKWVITAAHAGLSITESPMLCATAGCKSSLRHPLQCIIFVLQERLSETHPLVNEAITDYARAMNKITFDHAVKTRSSGVSGLAMVPLDSSTHQKLEARQVCSASPVLFLALMVTHCN